MNLLTIFLRQLMTILAFVLKLGFGVGLWLVITLG